MRQFYNVGPRVKGEKSNNYRDSKLQWSLDKDLSSVNDQINDYYNYCSIINRLSSFK